MGTGFSTSSEAKAARLPPQTFASSKISLESTSSFFCTSPWLFSESREPCPSARAPLLTRVLIALQARAIVSRRSRRSALIRSFCCRPTRYWVSVTRRMRRILRGAGSRPFVELDLGEPGAAEQTGGDQAEHRRHARRGRERAREERDQRVAAVEQRGAQAHRLALAPGGRRLVEERHDHRLCRAQPQAEDDGKHEQSGHPSRERKDGGGGE